MSDAAAALKIISGALSLVNAGIQLTGNVQKYQSLVSQAVAEGRDLSNDEIEQLRQDAMNAVGSIGGDTMGMGEK